MDEQANIQSVCRMRTDIAPLLSELRTALEDFYGRRLAKLILYGSCARYPSELSAISSDDARAAVREARRIVDAVQADLGARRDR